MDLAARIDHLDQMIRQAKAMPLSSSVLVNRDELLEAVRQMRESIPEEIKQARWVVKDRENLLAKARDKADELLEGAREEQRRMLSEEGVVQAAAAEARRILEAADESARQSQLEAEDYVDSKLAQFEVVMTKVVEDIDHISKAMLRSAVKVQAGRDKLRGPEVEEPVAEETAGQEGDAAVAEEPAPERVTTS